MTNSNEISKALKILRVWFDEKSHEENELPSAIYMDALRYRWLRKRGILGFSGPPSLSAVLRFKTFNANLYTLDECVDAGINEEMSIND